MSINSFNDFLTMKNSYSSKNIITKEKKDNIIKELDEMRKVLSKNKRKPTEKEKIFKN